MTRMSSDTLAPGGASTVGGQLFMIMSFKLDENKNGGGGRKVIYLTDLTSVHLIGSLIPWLAHFIRAAEEVYVGALGRRRKSETRNASFTFCFFFCWAPIRRLPVVSKRVSIRASSVSKPKKTTRFNCSVLPRQPKRNNRQKRIFQQDIIIN